jgi:hypothetical protein
MAFVKLLPPEGGNALPVADLIRRLENEFNVVDADPDTGQDYVAGMIAVTLRVSDAVPGKQERLAWFQSVQDAAVMVSFGDDLGLVASCCVLPDAELLFGSPDEVDGPARPLIERAAAVLGYEVFEG